MRNVIYAVCAAAIVAGLGLASPADADITIDFGIPAAPVHSDRYYYFPPGPDYMDMTTVNDTWYLTGGEAFPALAGQTGNLTLRIRVPNSERLIVSANANFATSFHWMQGGIASSGEITLVPSVTFVDPVGTPPSLFSANDARFHPRSSTSPPGLGSVFFHQHQSDVPADWGFGGIDITIPLASIVDTFPTTETLAGPRAIPSLNFSFSLPGNHEGTPAAEQFTSITPEPATLSLLTLAGLAVLRRRKRGMCK